MHRLTVPTYCVLFILLYGGTKAVERPYAIFQPGEYFDPFTENSAAETQSVIAIQALPSKQHRRTIASQPSTKQSVVPAPLRPQKPSFSVLHPELYAKSQHRSSGVAPPQPNVLYADLYKPKPRPIGHTSGTAQQFNPQLFKPSYFLGELEALAKKVDEIRRPKLQERKVEVPQQRTQLQKPQLVSSPVTRVAGRGRKENINRVQQINRVQPINRVQQNPQVLSVSDQRISPSADISALPLTLQQFYTAPKDLNGHLSSTSVASVQPIAVIEPPTSGSHDVHAHHLSAPHSSGHSASKSSGSGHSHKEEHHKSLGDKGDKDYKVSQHEHSDDYEKHEKHDDKAQEEEKSDKHHKTHDEAAHYKKHQEAEKSRKSGKFAEKKGHKRGHKTKGYHNKFHRDEYHREHKFYDDFHKEGFHEKHGDKHKFYKNKKGAYKKGKSGKSGHSSDKHGKKGFSKKGRVDEKHKGFSKKGGGQSHHKHHQGYHKKGGSNKGKHYGYQSDR